MPEKASHGITMHLGLAAGRNTWLNIALTPLFIAGACFLSAALSLVFTHLNLRWQLKPARMASL